MGSYLGTKLSYNPFWEEPEYQESMTDLQKMYCCGYEDGYGEGSEYKARLEVLEQQNESLRGLLAANVRVIKAEIKKELEEEKEQKETSHEVPPSA